MLESEIQNAIFLTYGREPDVTLYRNNTGQHAAELATRAHLERLLSFIASENRINDACSLIRSLLAEKQRFTRYGLCKGSSDIIGIVQREPSLNMGEAFESLARTERQLRANGNHHGIFLALEVKQPGKHPTAEQQMFLDLVNRRGGVGRCVHSVEEAGAAINEARAL